MRVDNYIAQYLYLNKKVSLQGIGSFLIKEGVSLPSEANESVDFQPDAIQFVYNPKTEEDLGLINFMVENTKKIRPLISADLDSYLVLCKQFLNIGKPFNLEGVGTLMKNQKGEFVFQPGAFTAPKIDTEFTPLREKAVENLTYDLPKNKPFNFKKFIAPFLGLALLGILGFLGYYLISSGVFKSKPKNEIAKSTSVVKVDSVKIKDSIKAAANNGYLAKDFNYKVVLRESNNKEAIKARVKQLIEGNGNKTIEMGYNKDSTLYRVITNITTNPLSDSTKVLDSLRKLFGDKSARLL